ncbi:MAG: hypothetical protein HQ559_13570 [Lentisphaerae bacterium]|nr:hypothetical protein [Lentisphaerota bacterium]
MTFRQFQSIFRPLVDRAWLAQCELTRVPPNDRAAKDRWYREQLWSCCRIRSTKNTTAAQQSELIERFGMLSQGDDRPAIGGWSDSQNARFADLSQSAWQKVCWDGQQGPFLLWLDRLLESCGVQRRQALDRKESFDQVMAALAVTAGDEYWIRRTAEAAEIRMRWQILRYLGDMEHLTKTPHTWDYVRGIWHQSAQFPIDMDDAPAETLRKVLAILDTHVRRLCKDYGIRPSELPSRSHPHETPVLIREDNHHLHVGHEIEHCESVHVADG